MTVSVPLLCGCGIFDRVFAPPNTEPTVYGTQPLSQSDEDLPIDLPRLIAPTLFDSDGADAKPPRRSDPADGILNLFGFYQYPTPDNSYDRRLERAYKYFNDTYKDSPAKARRSQIQEALVGKSTALCNLYKKQLLQTSTTQNLLTGDTTTILAGLAAIFSKAATARPLAAGAAIVSGARAEYNSSVFANLNMQVITAGVEKRRSEYYAAILKARSCKIEDYPLQEAVKDAFTFHAYCSLYAGLEEASLAIKQAQHPGLDEVTDSFNKLSNLINASQKAFGKAAFGTSPTAPPATNPTTDSVTFGASPTSQSVGQDCLLPIPGAPKSSVQAGRAATVTTQFGVLTMPFASSDDPVAAVAQAKTTIDKQLTDLTAQIATLVANDASLTADAKKQTDRITGSTGLRSQYLGTAAAPPNPAVPGSIDKITIPGTAGATVTPGDALTAYNKAYVALESTSNRADLGANSAALQKAQIDNAQLSHAVKDQMTQFDKDVQPIVDFVNNHTPKPKSS
jgi:hypothetical protein